VPAEERNKTPEDADIASTAIATEHATNTPGVRSRSSGARRHGAAVSHTAAPK